MRQKLAIKYGILAGVGTVAYLLLFYFIDPRIMLRAGVIWSTLIIFLIFMYRATVRAREEAEYFPLQAALRPAFTVYVLATLIYNAFYYILFTWIDPDLIQVQYELMLESPLLQDQVKDLSPEDFRVTLGNVALAAGRSIMGGFILSLIMAALLRRD